MTTQSEQPQERSVPEKRAAGLSLMLALADTTWRMFTPPAILVPLGLTADLRFHSAPWITLLMLPVSLSLSVLLIKRLMEQTK
jgi:hypothetical protein